MGLATRLHRGLRLAAAAAALYGLYRGPALARRLLRRPPRPPSAATHDRAARLLLRTALSLRGVTIKLCQVIATRADLFPPEVIRVLERCHDAVPPADAATIRAQVERELGKPVDAVFRELEPAPLASASLAQVHRAVLLDGREVAMKVQYPGVERLVRGDLADLRRLCRVYERLDPQPLALLPLLDELAHHLALELDFRREADFAERVRALFEPGGRVLVPRMHREWSTGRVLTMELVDGIKVTDRAALEAAGLRPQEVVQALAGTYARMIFGAGFFQADPHPGNLLVKPDGRLVLLDFGLSKELPEGFGRGLFELLLSMGTGDEATMLRAFRELGFETRSGDPGSMVAIAKRMLSRTRTGRFDGELNEAMANELYEAIRENPLVRVPTDVVLVGRVFELLSGIAHTLGARADMLRALGEAQAPPRPAGPAEPAEPAEWPERPA